MLTNWLHIAALAQDGPGSEIFSGLAIILLLIAFIPTLVAGFAPGRPFQAFIVLLLNIGSLFGLVFFIVPGVVIWLVALVVAVMVYNGARSDKQHRELMRVLQQQGKPVGGGPVGLGLSLGELERRTIKSPVPVPMPSREPTKPGHAARDAVRQQSGLGQQQSVFRPEASSSGLAQPKAELHPPSMPWRVLRVVGLTVIVLVSAVGILVIVAPPFGFPDRAGNTSAAGFAVQLSVTLSEESARAQAQVLQRKYASELGGRALFVRTFDVNGETRYSVRVGPMSKDDANALCTKVKSGTNCFVAKN